MAGARVAVIGGGFAGLAAASRLAALGCEVALFEREPRPGGRAGSEREKDFAFEPGAHVLASSDLRLLALVARAGLAGDLLPLRAVALAQVERGRVYRIHPQSPRGVGRIPGLGRLTVDAILRRDYPVIQGVILMFSFVYVLVNLCVDLMYTLFDPRIRY